jgi:hypothetical protein
MSPMTHDLLPARMPLSALEPGNLPPPEAPERWAFLQALRRGRPIIGTWLMAIESGRTLLLPDLLASLKPHLDAEASLQLLRFWLQDSARDPGLVDGLATHRDAAHARLLREALLNALERRTPEANPADPGSSLDPLMSQLPPLLGHQRCPEDFHLLSAVALAFHPTPVRLAALEGLLRGLSAWPLQPLRVTLRRLARDHHPRLAATAIDALTRLPQPRAALHPLRGHPYEPELATRLQRRLRASPPARLLLLVHGRTAGLMPEELPPFAAELEQRRGALVDVITLTGFQQTAYDPGELPCCLVPLLMLPGQHVRFDLAVITEVLRRRGTLRRVPFLGAWPLWQRALAEEADRLAAGAGGRRPLLLHHPLEGALPQRYLRHLASLCGAECVASPSVSPIAAEHPPTIDHPLLPLMLAANRFTEQLAPQVGAPESAPLLQRPHLRQQLLDLLETLP